MVQPLWIGLAGGSLGAGAALAVLLVVSRNREGLIMALGVALMVLSAISGSQLTLLHDTPALPVVVGLIALCSAGGGFALVSSLLPYVRPRPIDVTMPRPAEPAGVLTLLLAESEADTYRPSEVTREIEELVDAGLSEPGLTITPFHYAAQKARYRSIGGRSPEERSHRDLAERLESRLDSDIFAGVLVLRCAEQGVLASALRAAREAAYSRVVVADAYIAQSRRARRERDEAEALGPEIDGMSVAYCRPLWTSDELARLVAVRTLSVRSGAGKTGVALVVHSQPADDQQLNERFDIEENAFANRVRMYLADEGLDPEHIRVCAAEWSEPGVAETVRHLAALGNERILVVPACHPFPNLQTLIDIPAAIRDARVPESVRVVQIPPWGDEEAFASVLAAAIEDALAESGM